ncbi:MAG: DUF1232 domain-containing protein [Pirellulales bacterium]
MSSFMNLLTTLIVCMTILGIAFMVVLAMPQSKMREVSKNVMLAICCFIYVVSPIDVLPEIALGPFGFLDDLGAAVVGIKAARIALNS